MYIRAAMVGAAIALLIGVYFYGRSDGWNSRDAEYREAAARETARQISANTEAQERSRAREQSLLDEIARLRKLSRILSDAADKDPNADRDAIGADSVRRLNQFNEAPGPQ